MRNLRKNLRIVLRLAIRDEIHRLSKLEGLYRNKRLRNKQTPSQWKREIQISRLSDKFMHLARRSSCITCNEPYCISHNDRPGKSTWFEHRSTDLDLVWIPWYEKWVCLECYKEYYKDTTLEDVIKAKMQSDESMCLDDDKLYKVVRKDDSQKFTMIRGDKLVRMIEKDIKDKFKDTFDNK